VTDWITPEEVAAYLDLPGAPDDNLIASTAAAKAAVERRRSDLGLAVDGATAPGDVRLGTMIWASLLYQTRSSPSGFVGYGDETQIYDALGARRAEVMRLLGWRRPVVA
jgi:hypothetical protein